VDLGGYFHLSSPTCYVRSASIGCVTPKPLKWLFGRSISRIGNGKRPSIHRFRVSYSLRCPHSCQLMKNRLRVSGEMAMPCENPQEPDFS
jgi:hypothetical protein